MVVYYRLSVTYSTPLYWISDPWVRSEERKTPTSSFFFFFYSWFSFSLIPSSLMLINYVTTYPWLLSLSLQFSVCVSLAKYDECSVKLQSLFHNKSLTDPPTPSLSSFRWWLVTGCGLWWSRPWQPETEWGCRTLSSWRTTPVRRPSSRTCANGLKRTSSTWVSVISVFVYVC